MALGSFVSVAILIRTYGASGYGTLAIVTGVTGLAAVAVPNLDEAIRRFLPEYHRQGDTNSARSLVATVIWSRFAASVFVALVLLGLSHHIAQAYIASPSVTDLLRVGSAAIVLSSLDSLSGSVFAGIQRFGTHAWYALAASAVNLGVAVLAATLGQSLLWYFAVTLLARAILGVLALASALRATFGATGAGFMLRFSSSHLRSVLRYAMPLWGGYAATAVGQNGSRAILGIFVPADVVGLFSVAKSLVDQLGGVLVQLSAVLLPVIAADESSATDPVLRRRVRLAGDGTLVAAAIAGSGVSLVAPELTNILFGYSTPVVTVLVGLLALGMVGRLVTSALGSLFFYRELTGSVLALNLLRVLVLVSLIGLLTPRLGVGGAAVAEAVAFVVGYWYLNRSAARNLMPGCAPPLYSVAQSLLPIGLATILALAFFEPLLPRLLAVLAISVFVLAFGPASRLELRPLLTTLRTS